MGKAVIILVAGTIINFGLANLSSVRGLTEATETAVDYYSCTQGRNIANTMADMILSKLWATSSWRVNSAVSKNFFGGTAMYTVEDAFFAGDTVVRINVTADYSGRNTTVTVYARRPSSPPTIRGAITARNDIALLGGFVLDGRDHTLGGALIPTSGTYAVWTTETLSQSGATLAGGTAAGIDYVPANPGNPAVIKENQVWPGGYPGTPDSVLGGASNGFPEGRLKAIAQSGLGGSQYVTNISALSYPLKGVTYLDSPPGKVPSGVLKNISGSGLLVVHNTALDASISNTVGNFAGLIIVDDIDKIQTDIIGAVVSITKFPSAGKIVGNSNGALRYSREVVRGVVEKVHKLGGSKSSVIAWQE